MCSSFYLKPFKIKVPPGGRRSDAHIGSEAAGCPPPHLWDDHWIDGIWFWEQRSRITVLYQFYCALESIVHPNFGNQNQLKKDVHLIRVNTVFSAGFLWQNCGTFSNSTCLDGSNWWTLCHAEHIPIGYWNLQCWHSCFAKPKWEQIHARRPLYSSSSVAKHNRQMKSFN